MTPAKAAVAAVTAGLLGCCVLYASLPATAEPQREPTVGSQSVSVEATAAESSATPPGDLLEQIVITGSLIPQAPGQVATPVTVITAEDIEARGYKSIADALQQTSFATTSVENAQTGGFTHGVPTFGMFGLPPSYLKILVDGLPLSDYPALYGGTDVFTSVAGIPMALVDRIEILPGGRSSVYGSDAIAGVINIIMKRHVDGTEASARYGFTSGGGGVDKAVSLATGGHFDRLEVLGGIEYENRSPIWGYDRELTSSIFASGTSPPVAERDFLILGRYGPSGDGSNRYYFKDPAQCADLTSLFNGSLRYQVRAGQGGYCGTTQVGFYTIDNGDESVQGYLRGTYDLGGRAEFYGDLLLNNEVMAYSPGAKGYFTNDFYDPNLGDLIHFQRLFSPEEMGSAHSRLDSTTINMIRFTIGGRGLLTSSGWTYDLGLTYNGEKLAERTRALLTQSIVAFYAPLYGSNLGPDPYGFGVSTFTPDYASFYHALTPAEFASISDVYKNFSRTENTNFRAQFTNANLFGLPGGKAGAALVLEGGRQEWSYVSDPGFLTNRFWGVGDHGVSVGSRTRAATTAELRLPVARAVTLDLSGRYDDFKVQDNYVGKGTYSLGVEVRPRESFLLRGRLGTAFKAPTLADEFKGRSSAFGKGVDYYLCEKNGYTPKTIGNCPYSGDFTYLYSGNPKLQAITAQVWGAGLVWTPVKRLAIGLDYLHWAIRGEVANQGPNSILLTEAACRLAKLDISSPSCVNDISYVTRDPSTGYIVSVFDPKINVSLEELSAVIANVQYSANAGLWGQFEFEGSWTDMLAHHYQRYPGDPVLDLLRDPFDSTDFTSKANASVTWKISGWSTTLYADRVGRSPNNLATTDPAGYAVPGAADLPPWTVANLSIGYHVARRWHLTATVTNLFNAMPPEDRTYSGLDSAPYNAYNYNVYGRNFLIELSYGSTR